ncbi:MAG: hypothetical protein ABF289_05765 [Clostridiales bacterium]
MNDHYTKCYIKGQGEVLNRGIKFDVEDISAIEADIVTDYKLNSEKVYNLEIGFTANLVECKFKTDVKILDEKVSGARYYYNIQFLNLTESKKVEIDELLKRACIIKDRDNINKCDYGDCKVSNNKK